jgi:hypothetical protein
MISHFDMLRSFGETSDIPPVLRQFVKQEPGVIGVELVYEDPMSSGEKA